MIKKDLEDIGLNKNEVSTYLALQEIGKTKAGEIIKETGLHRNLVYQSLGSLAEKRLLTKSTAGNVALFQATDPIHLLDGIREQELTAQRVIEELKEKKKIVDQEITVYEGAEGMRAFNLKNAENLKLNETIYVLGSDGQKFEQAMGARAMKKYFSLVEKNGSMKVLMYQAQQDMSEMYTVMRNAAEFSLRVLPYDMTPSVSIIFTKESVGFLLFEEPMTVIEIKNIHLVEVYKQYFDILWNQQIRVETGMDAVKRAFLKIVDELKSGDSYYSIGTQIGESGSELADFFETYHKIRVQKGVVCNLLSYKQDTKTIRSRFHKAGDDDEQVSHVRPLAQTVTGFMQTILYREKVFIPIYGDHPMAITFENKQFYDGFKQYFDELWNQNTEMLSGLQAIIELNDRVLEEGQDLYLIGANGFIPKIFPLCESTFTKRREENGLHLHMLTREQVHGTPFSRLPLSSVKYLPSHFESPMVIWIFGDYVAHVLWQEPQTGFLIHDKKTAEYFMQYYETLKRMAT
ncbi:TPA: hypothetical protein DCW61_04015 [Candidatus Uhrbacteria bacterium]|nr:hypothetical protein [Candidatus Uhrbacteria bacterium]